MPVFLRGGGKPGKGEEGDELEVKTIPAYLDKGFEGREVGSTHAHARTHTHITLTRCINNQAC